MCQSLLKASSKNSQLIFIQTVFSVAIDLIVQHIRDFLSNRLDQMLLSPTATPSLSGVISSGGRGKDVNFNGDSNFRPH